MTGLMKAALAASVVALLIQTPVDARKFTQIGDDMGKCPQGKKNCACKDSACAQIAAPPSNPTRGHSNINAHPSRLHK